MNSINLNTTPQTALPFPWDSEKTSPKREKTIQLEHRYWYSAKEACIYLGCSQWILRRMIDLRLIKPKKWTFLRYRVFWTAHLDIAMERYEALKNAGKLNDLPLCTCLNADN